MTDTSRFQSKDGETSHALGPWERWEEHDGEPVIVWDEEAHAAWIERWRHGALTATPSDSPALSASGSGTWGSLSFASRSAPATTVPAG